MALPVQQDEEYLYLSLFKEIWFLTFYLTINRKCSINEHFKRLFVHFLPWKSGWLLTTFEVEICWKFSPSKSFHQRKLFWLALLYWYWRTEEKKHEKPWQRQYLVENSYLSLNSYKHWPSRKYLTKQRDLKVCQDVVFPKNVRFKSFELEERTILNKSLLWQWKVC